MQILSAAEMMATDRRTGEQSGIPLEKLMEHAGAAVAEFCLAQFAEAEKVVVLAGKGNNGGDGLVAAISLAARGRDVRVLLLGRGDELKGEPANLFKNILTSVPAVRLEEIDDSSLDTAKNAIEDADLVLDAIVGTGFKPPLRGMAAALREVVQHTHVKVVAIDLPSGWDADSTEQNADGAYRADAVVTFTAPKPAHVFGHVASGPVVVAPIGSPAAAVQSEGRLHWTGSAKRIAEAPRDVNSNKGKYGHVLVIGGSYGTSGAPSMASLAALRTGAGLVTAAVPMSIVDPVAAITPELMMTALEQDAEGTVSMKNLGGVVDAVIREKRITVAAIGPGLSTRGGASAFAREFVAKARLPMVVDADALNAFADMASLLSGEGRTLVLTPHPGEMARLLGTSVKDVEANRVELARRFSTEHALTLVLKGWRTLIAHPNGQVAVNTTGNPAMAKGGSGDILTGIIAAMLAQYAHGEDAEDVAKAVEAAVFLHGLAGDFAARRMDEHTVLATDTLQHLSDAFRYRVEDQRGMVWLCGVRV